MASLDPLLDMGVLKPPLQVSFVMGVTGGIRPTARNVAHMAEQVPDVEHQWGVIGISRAQWGLLAAALSLGRQHPRRAWRTTSICRTVRWRAPTASWSRGRRGWRVDAGRRLATVAEARAMLGLT